tara:strand:+ start:402 stop:881 length:480 start_codon:yes stop_codon:yes gene_type:complete
MAEIIERHKEKNSLGLERTVDLMDDGTLIIRGFSQDVNVVVEENNKSNIKSIELQGGDYFDTSTAISFDKKTVKITGFEMMEDEMSKEYSVVKVKCLCTNVPKKEAVKLSENKQNEIATESKEEKVYTQDDLERMSLDEIQEMNAKKPGFFRKIMKNFT